MATPLIIDADTHVLEPPNLWRDYVDPALREKVPFIERQVGAGQVLTNFELYVASPDAARGIRESMAEFGVESVGHAGAFGAQWTGEPIDIDYESVREGYDPSARLALMDRSRIDAASLYPTMGLLLGGYRDPLLAAAVYRAYNRWLSEFCSFDPARLVGAAMLPMQDIDLAINELRYAVEDLGMPLIVLRPNPYAGRMLNDKYFDPFWERVADYGIGTAIHSGSAEDMPTVAMDRYGDTMITRHIVSHSLEIMLSMLNLIYAGPAERFPSLRFAFFEGGGGWVPGWIDRMDRHFQKSYSDVKMSRRPSDIFRSQCWVCFDPGEGSLAWAAKYLGEDRVLWASDYPHPDGVPDGAALIADNPDISDDAKLRILGLNALTFIGRSLSG